MDFKALIAECDLNLKQGRGHLVAEKLGELNLSAIDRAYRLPLARICRRAGLFAMGLRLLMPLVYSDRNRWISEALPEIRTEYAALLSKNGNNEEALKILGEVPVTVVPEAALYMGFCHMARWDYEKSAEDLTRYLQTGPELYAQVVANVNLGASYVALGDWPHAKQILDANIAVCERHKFSRLQANSLELRGQMNLRQNKLGEAREDLNQASRILGSDSTADNLFVVKWKAILDAFAKNDPTQILDFREQAKQRGHWESVRDADRFVLMLEFDQERFNRLVFGTPFASFRKRLCQELGHEPEVDIYRNGPKGSIALNLVTGDISGGGGSVNPRVLHLLSIFNRDFYRPVKLGALFAQLFPNDHFDIYSSPNRVHQSLWRARSWVKQSNLPVKFEEVGGDYKLVTTADFSFFVPLEWPEESNQWLEKLRAKFGYEEFSAASACRILNLSRSTFLRKCQQTSEIEKRFKGSAVSYRLRRSFIVGS